MFWFYVFIAMNLFHNANIASALKAWMVVWKILQTRCPECVITTLFNMQTQRSTYLKLICSDVLCLIRHDEFIAQLFDMWGLHCTASGAAVGRHSYCVHLQLALKLWHTKQHSANAFRVRRHCWPTFAFHILPSAYRKTAYWKINTQFELVNAYWSCSVY